MLAGVPLTAKIKSFSSSGGADLPAADPATMACTTHPGASDSECILGGGGVQSQ
jgi:hypothetical protein